MTQESEGKGRGLQPVILEILLKMVAVHLACQGDVGLEAWHLVWSHAHSVWHLVWPCAYHTSGLVWVWIL